MRILATFTFEAAHFLPNVPSGHKCGRTHGHNWQITVVCAGEPDAHTGWILDFFEIEEVWQRCIHTVVDHQLLNEIPGLQNPTSEVIARWIWTQVKPCLPMLAEVTVHETPRFGVTYSADAS